MAKIGIFDSGVGGLSVFREIRKVLPEGNYIYYSDNANCPYGEKSEDFIIERARQITGLLIEKGAEIIVIACNTATAAAIKTLRAEYAGSIRFIGMEPAIKPAAQVTQSGVVGVLATAGTLNSEKYLRHKEKYASDIRIIEHIGEGFVELVEKGIVSGKEAEDIVRVSLTPLIKAGADTIVLGCTHYPFLAATIRKVAEEILTEDSSLHEITIIDPAPAIAKRLMEVLREENLLKGGRPEQKYSLTLLSSGSSETLEKTATYLDTI